MGLALMVRTQIKQSFVARIWLEYTENQDPNWRGHIRHIQGSEETYFQGLSEMSEFMQQVSSCTEPETTEEPDKVVTISKRNKLANLKIKPGNRDDRG
jgi:hypothetical protein